MPTAGIPGSRRPTTRTVTASFGNALVLGLMNLPLLRALALPLSSNVKATEEEGASPDDPALWIYLSVAMALVLLGGIFAGLTIALMGQDEIYLEVLHSSGDEKERLYSGKVLRLLKRGKHWVLVTLLLSNVITNETLPIVLDRSLGGGWPAVVSSTALIVIFGEVIPQSICVRYGLPIGAYLSPVVLGLMYIMSPLAWPTAKLLDYLLGEDHGTVYKKAGLKTLVTLHMSLGKSPGERLNEDEVTIITSVLDLKSKPVNSIMTPIDDVFTMSSDAVLDEETVDGILAAGYSRIPIHTPDNPVNFIGMLLVRMLITYDPEDASRVCDLALAALPETKPETSCLDVINFFQEGKSHMLLVSDNPGDKSGALGVVTLEDVIEELIGEEIIDESDVYIDNEHNVRRTHNEPVIIQPGELDPNGNPSKPFATTYPEFGLPHRRSTGGSLLGYSGLTRVPSHSHAHGGKRGRSYSPLRHLGPSNPASKPAQTKYSNIKLKPGKGLDGDVLQATAGVRAVDGEGGAGEGGVQGNETTPLLGGPKT